MKIDKAATALVTGVLCWVFYFFSGQPINIAEHELLKHLGEIAAILFFLLGAITIVEVIDSHHFKQKEGVTGTAMKIAEALKTLR